jgi:predicted RNA-binding protein YlqC (UPF0109 family)
MMQEANHDDMQQLVLEIAKALVDDPHAVEVQAVARDENTVLRLRVASADVGKVIGKQGRTARSMRTILSAVSMKLHHRYTLDILEEDEARKPADSYAIQLRIFAALPRRVAGTNPPLRIFHESTPLGISCQLGASRAHCTSAGASR